jgi:uncharacterized membrane protein (DUF4010 family)
MMLDTANWPYLESLERLALALALGLFVGLERERRGKDAGVRTFAFAGLLGGMGGLLGETYAILSILLIGLLVALLNVGSLRTLRSTELTTSAALLVAGFTGVLCGLGHTLTPAAVAVASAALLAWKEPLTGFSLELSEAEIRAAVLLGILAVVVYPALPESSVDPWNLVQPREAWGIVVLIAAIGFVNYILWKLYGTRGIALSGFLGGLLNSTVTASEVAGRAQEDPCLARVAYQAILLANGAMILRNLGIIGLLSPAALLTAGPPLAAMLAVWAILAIQSGRGARGSEQSASPEVTLAAPFSLFGALRFGLIFLALQVGGTLAQRGLGQAGFYVVSAIGGFISSSGAVASAGALASQGAITPAVGGTGSVLATVTSALITLPLVARVAPQSGLARPVGLALGLMTVAGVAVAMVMEIAGPSLGL